MESFTAQFRVINYFPCEKGFSTPPRVFDYPYLLYVHGGRGAYKVNGRRYECERGDLFYCPPFEENVIFADEYEPFILSGLEFTVSDVHFLNENMPRRANLNDDPFAASCILKMIDEYLYDKTGAGEICSHLLSALLLELFRAQTRSAAPPKRPAREIMRYLSQNAAKKVTYTELSENFHYHKNTINRLVKEAAGVTPKEYAIRQKIKEAQKFLCFTDMSAEEISQALGYSSPCFFSQQFKQKTGFTPAQFRNRNKTP